MKFHKAVELLRKDPEKVLESRSISMYEQTIESLTHWIYNDNFKLINLTRCLKAKDWELKPKGNPK